MIPQETPESEIAADEVVVFYPTLGRHIEDGRAWALRIHGVVFHPQDDSLKRTATVSFLRRMVGLTADQPETEIFNRRMRAFLVDHLPHKTIHVHLGEQTYSVGPSHANGHFESVIRVPAEEADRLAPSQPNQPRWLEFNAITRPDDPRQFQGRVQLLEETGLSILSDIDDTIKHTHVTDRKEMMRNTFERPFEAVPGMAALYQEWAKLGVAFHYLSASPWQLFDPLSQFFADTGLPPGSIRLKNFRLRDGSALRIWRSPQKYKPAVVETLLTTFPQRRFVLIGDSGEKDPEIFAALARQHPEQIVQILIRDVHDLGPDAPRYVQALEGIPAEHFKIFRTAEEIADWKLPVMNNALFEATKTSPPKA